MPLQERLQQEALNRAAVLAARFNALECIACRGPGTPALKPITFHWRKQVGRSSSKHVRVEHATVLPMCSRCASELRSWRPFFWVLRYAGGIGLAVSLIGVITGPLLLLFMRLSPAERAGLLTLGGVAMILLPIALGAQAIARRYSVPRSLWDMTEGGWECVSIRVP